jgi:hypothetical protein
VIHAQHETDDFTEGMADEKENSRKPKTKAELKAGKMRETPPELVHNRVIPDIPVLPDLEPVAGPSGLQPPVRAKATANEEFRRALDALKAQQAALYNNDEDYYLDELPGEEYGPTEDWAEEEPED